MVRVKQTPRRKLEWWEKLASPTKEQWAYANAFHRAEARGAKQRRRAGRHPPMKKTPTMKKSKMGKKKGKTCLSLAHLARRYPDITKTVCFYPKQATMRSLINATPRRISKVQAWYK